MFERLVDAPPPPDDLSGVPGLSVVANPGPLACRLVLDGRLEANTVSLVTSCLDGWVSSGLRHIVVDLTDVRHVDAAASAALTRAAHVLGRTGGSLTLLVPPHLVDGPLATCGLDLIRPEPVTSRDGMAIGVRRNE